MNRQKITWIDFVPWLVDGVTLLLLWLLPTAVIALQTPSASNVIYLIAVYALMCAGVFLIRRLEPGAGMAGEASSTIQPLWLALGVLFGAAVMTAMAFQFDYFAAVFAVDTMALGEGESATFFVFAPGAWLGTSLLYTAFLALPLTPRVAPGEDGRYLWQAFLGLLFSNSMFFFMAAQLKAVLALLGGPGLFIAFPLAFVLLLLLFGPPRLLYWRKQGGLTGVSFLLLTAVAAFLVAS